LAKKAHEGAAQRSLMDAIKPGTKIIQTRRMINLSKESSKPGSPTGGQGTLLLRALRKEKVERPPVWMMRQAGRYLPDYIKLRDKYDFFTRVQTPELATEITLQPVDQVGVDAAIIFSDILVIPQAMGVEVLMEEGKGPSLPKTIKTQQDIDALNTADAEEHLKYVLEALSLTKKELAGRVPLIGFAGAPWTILCYMVEGKGSKTWDKAKQFAYTQPQLAHALLQKITDITIDYLKAQVAAGADTVQVFDSWAGSLSPEDFKAFAQPYLLQIADAVSVHAPVILFPKGTWYALKDLSRSSASGIGIDWTITPRFARELTGNNITLQGNFDPAKLLAPIPQIKKWAKEMIDGFGAQAYIANLGHGITPNVPVDHARAFVEAVKEYSPHVPVGET
jgi:uroporphyrinogen decarboxylase